MRTGNVSPRIGRFKKASTKPTKTSYMQDKLNKLSRTIPAQRPQTQGSTYRPLRVQTDSTAKPTAKTTRNLTKQEIFELRFGSN